MRYSRHNGSGTGGEVKEEALHWGGSSLSPLLPQTSGGGPDLSCLFPEARRVEKKTLTLLPLQLKRCWTSPQENNNKILKKSL